MHRLLKASNNSVRFESSWKFCTRSKNNFCDDHRNSSLLQNCRYAAKKNVFLQSYRFSFCKIAAIQCNRTGRIASPQAAAPSTTSSNSSSESELPHQQASTSVSLENELQQLFPQSRSPSRKRSVPSPDNESTSKRAYTISALLDFPKSSGTLNTDENAR